MGAIAGKLVKKYGIDLENAELLEASDYPYPALIRAASRADLEEIVDESTLIILKGEA